MENCRKFLLCNQGRFIGSNFSHLLRCDNQDMSFLKKLGKVIAEEWAKSNATQQARPNKPKELPIPGADTTVHAVVGEEFYLTDKEIRNLKPGHLIATAEPTNKHDKNAVVMHDTNGRKVGYMSAGLAKRYQKYLIATGPVKLPMTKNGNVIKYRIATVAALRKYVDTL